MIRKMTKKQLQEFAKRSYAARQGWELRKVHERMEEYYKNNPHDYCESPFTDSREYKRARMNMRRRIWNTNHPESAY